MQASGRGEAWQRKKDVPSLKMADKRLLVALFGELH